MKNIKRRISTVVLVLLFCVGMFLLLYPVISDLWNSYHQSKAVSGYVENVNCIDEDRYKDIWARAEAYNAVLAENGNNWKTDEKELEEYNRQLNVDGTGIMGYIEIPVIECKLPVYHGTDEDVLQIAIGHIEGSSLPVGGESTHCVLSGHRGLPSARLFTDIDRLDIGDVFIVHTLDEELTYEVDRINIVLPNEIEKLAIEEGKDLCTLVTCTPYGVNSHRLLVRGHRVENRTEAAARRVIADATQIDPIVVASLVAIPMLLILLIVLLVTTGKKK